MTTIHAKHIYGEHYTGTKAGSNGSIDISRLNYT